MEVVTVGAGELLSVFRSSHLVWKYSVRDSLWLVDLSGLFPSWPAYVHHYHWCTIW